MAISEKAIDKLVRDVRDAEAHLADCRQKASFARSQETDALNRLNAAQRALDTAIETMKKSADRDSDWKRAKQAEPARRRRAMALSDDDYVELPCLYCKKLLRFPKESPEHRGVFNVFCPDGECEDKYAATL